jgi:NAD(P)-dependent dehydrogenase (short-subunit alcohol dehydrogenase family)
MDVTDEESVVAAFRDLVCHVSTGDGFESGLDPAGLDGVVCCAAVFTAGPLAIAADDALGRAFDVNVMGAHRIVKEAFPLLTRRAGSVILISSESARFAMPFNGPYTISKCALEAYADCLRRELILSGVRVSVIQPGAFRSGLLARADEAVAGRSSSSRFDRQLALVRKLLDRERQRGMAPDTVARVVVRALLSRRPRARYRVGNNQLHVLLRLFPARVADALIKLVMR